MELDSSLYVSHKNTLALLTWQCDLQNQLAAPLLSNNKPYQLTFTRIAFLANSCQLLLHKNAATYRNVGALTALQHHFTLANINNAKVQPHQKDHLLKRKLVLFSLNAVPLRKKRLKCPYLSFPVHFTASFEFSQHPINFTSNWVRRPALQTNNLLPF